MRRFILTPVELMMRIFMALIFLAAISNGILSLTGKNYYTPPTEEVVTVHGGTVTVPAILAEETRQVVGEGIMSMVAVQALRDSTDTFGQRLAAQVAEDAIRRSQAVTAAAAATPLYLY